MLREKGQIILPYFCSIFHIGRIKITVFKDQDCLFAYRLPQKVDDLWLSFVGSIIIVN